jgi:ABC-2 type transport system permease protein
MTTEALEMPTTSRDATVLRSGFDVRALWTLYTLTLRQHIRGKRWIVMMLLFLIPAALAIVVRATAPDAPPLFIEFVFAFTFIPQALLPLVALLYASGVIQDELEEQTITYLLIRPIPKWALYIVKMLATITTAVALTVICTGFTYVAVYARGPEHEHILSRYLTAIAIHSLAVVTYCCLFGLISFLTKRGLVFGIIYAAIVEGLMANLPLSIRLITVIYYTRVIAYRTLQFVGVGPQGPEDIANNAWQLGATDDPLLLEHPQRATCIIVLVTASFALLMLGAFLCWRREFYVKTPEKS